MSEKVKCIIDEVKFKDKQFLSPILVTFQHGQLRPEKAANLKCSVFAGKKRKKRLFSLESVQSGITYKGSPLVDAQNTCKTMIAIRNRKTNKIRLFETETLVLAPCINQVEKKSEDLELSFADKMHNLAKTFGSKKGKRINEQRQRLLFDNNEITDELKGALDTMDVSFKAEAQSCAVGGIPWNRDADKLEDVYQLFDLISELELKSLRKEAHRVKKNDIDLSLEKYSNFFMKSLPVVLKENSKDKQKLKERLELLIYIDYLIMHARCNYNLPFKDADILCHTSPLLNDKLIKEFTVVEIGNRRLCTRQMKDKATCHVIVLSLILFNFKVDLTEIGESIDQPISKLKLFSAALGAPCVKDSKLAVLRVPLVIPIPRDIRPAAQKIARLN